MLKPIRGPTNDYPVLDLSKLDPSHVKLFQTVDNGKVVCFVLVGLELVASFVSEIFCELN